ncbi:BON domain-containing protein [Pseudomonas abieticivorans]|uniref:BON domain-containing protein n=1 Tax=Pseudomonas abieticivorans TaxID=2931382 RepID=UPI003F693BB4
MHPFKKLALACAVTLPMGLVSCGVQAAQADQGSVASQLDAARQEGSIWTSFALNKHLSPFKIQVGVHDGTAVLKGQVETQVDRELAEQIALDTSGINKVDNQLVIDPALAEQNPAPQTISRRVEDATLTATIKSKLLWNSMTQALDTTVDTKDGVVTLKGHAQTADAKLLAGDLATNTDGVTEVNNLISLGAADANTTKAEAAAKSTEDSISDAWITSKVKASLLYSRNLDGLSINVDTKGGMVNLDGVVATSEEKTLAVDIARNIRGVRGVDADLLKVANKTTS